MRGRREGNEEERKIGLFLVLCTAFISLSSSSHLYTPTNFIQSLINIFFSFLLELFPLSYPFTPGRDLGIGACLGSLTPSGIFSGFGTNNDPGTFVLLLILLSFIISYVCFSYYHLLICQSTITSTILRSVINLSYHSFLTQQHPVIHSLCFLIQNITLPFPSHPSPPHPLPRCEQNHKHLYQHNHKIKHQTNKLKNSKPHA